MADITLPRANQALINQRDGPQGNAGTATREFYNFLLQLATLTSNAELQAEIEAILVRLEALEQGSDFTIQGNLSVAVTGQPSNGLVALALRNDVAVPGSSFYYGTNSFGVKGWYAIPAGGGVLPIVTGEIVSGQPVFVIGPDGSLVYGPV
jgi:hypothetical protein